jgi:hypothetical protein
MLPDNAKLVFKSFLIYWSEKVLLVIGLTTGAHRED